MAQARKALPANDADWIGVQVSQRADLAGDLMTQALALREAIHAIGAALGIARRRLRRRSPAFPPSTRSTSPRRR